MDKFILFYGVWALVCTICLIIVEESDNYLSKEWKIKDIIQAIVLFPITIIMLFVNLIFYLVEKFEESKAIQIIYKFLNKPIKKENKDE